MTSPPDDDQQDKHAPKSADYPELGFDQDDLIKLASWTMPFGRFAGRTLIYLPEEYLFWFVDHGFPDGKLGFLMKLALELKVNGADGVVRDLAKAMDGGRQA